MSTTTEEISVLDGITAMILKIMRGSKAQISTTETLISINVSNNQLLTVDFATAPILVIAANYPANVKHSYDLNDPSAMDRMLECIKVLASVMSNYFPPAPQFFPTGEKPKKWTKEDEFISPWAEWIYKEDDGITWTYPGTTTPGKSGKKVKGLTHDMLFRPKDWYMSVSNEVNNLKSQIGSHQVTWGSTSVNNMVYKAE